LIGGKGASTLVIRAPQLSQKIKPSSSWFLHRGQVTINVPFFASPYDNKERPTSEITINFFAMDAFRSMTLLPQLAMCLLFRGSPIGTS
jgi:hypothetical protein